MRILLCSVLLMTVAVDLSAAQNYCNITSCGAGAPWHTMCVLPKATPGANCGNQIAAIGPTQAERNMFVATHNNLRKFVAQGYEKRGAPGAQPNATNMKTMEWDYELETIAQRWASQCFMGKDFCRDVSAFTVNQNVGMLSTIGEDTFTPNDMLQIWYDEVLEFDKRDVASYRANCKVERYSQMVWAESSHLGCGTIRYKQDGGANAYFVVCNYGPAGNIPGQPIYKTP